MKEFYIIKFINYLGLDKKLAEPFASFVRASALSVFGHFAVDHEPNVSSFKR